jgi:hypothetical protein
MNRVVHFYFLESTLLKYGFRINKWPVFTYNINFGTSWKFCACVSIILKWIDHVQIRTIIKHHFEYSVFLKIGLSLIAISENPSFVWGYKFTARVVCITA